MVRLLSWAIASALFAGAATELVAYRLGEVSRWAPDLVTGGFLLVCGGLAASRRRTRATGLLLAGAGAAWFVANLVPAAVYLHRALLAHAALTYPSGRTRGRLDRAAVLLGYALALLPSLAGGASLTCAYAIVLVVAAAASWADSAATDRRARRWGVAATVGLALVLVVVAMLREIVHTGAVERATILAYELVVMAIAAALAAGAIRRPKESWTETADHVVDFTDKRPGSVQEALAHAVGDPSLQLGFWSQGAVAWLDEEGREVTLPSSSSSRQSTRIDGAGHPLALLVHDAAVLDDQELLRAVEAVTRLAGANARLQTEVKAQVSDLERSRRRLMRAEDEARHFLEQRLRTGVGQRLDELSTMLIKVSRHDARHLRPAVAQLDVTRAALQDLAAGLHPLAQLGIAAAVDELAARATLPVAAEVTNLPIPDEIAEAAYFVCSEALANTAKHADAARASVSVRLREQAVVIEITDNGIGGAVLRDGSGLQGLRDRVDSMGGVLEIRSGPGLGTCVRASLPMP